MKITPSAERKRLRIDYDDFRQKLPYKNSDLLKTLSEVAVRIGAADTCKAVLTGTASSDLFHKGIIYAYIRTVQIEYKASVNDMVYML